MNFYRAGNNNQQIRHKAGTTKQFSSQAGSGSQESVDDGGASNPQQVSQDDSSSVSDMVPGLAGKPPQPPDTSTSYKLVNILDRISSSLLTRDSKLEKKRAKVSELKERQKELEGYLDENKVKMERLEEDIHDMKVKYETAQQTVMEKEQKIEQLQDHVYQKDRELQEEKDEKQEKCEELERAQASLRREITAKEEAESKLEKAFEIVKAQQNLYRQLQHEDPRFRLVLQWTNNDLKEENDEIEEVLERQKIVKWFLLSIIAVIVVVGATIIHIVMHRCDVYS